MTVATSQIHSTIARISSTCKTCKKPVLAGDAIAKSDGERRWSHATCHLRAINNAIAAEDTTPAPVPAPVEDNGHAKRATSRGNQVCPKCRNMIRKGHVKMRWLNGPRHPSGQYKWIHEDCAKHADVIETVKVSETGTVAPLDVEAVKKVVDEALQSLDLTALAQVCTNATEKAIGEATNRMDGMLSKHDDASTQALEAFEANLPAVVQQLVEQLTPRELEIRINDNPPVTLDEHLHQNFEEVLRLCSVRLKNGHRPNIFLPGPSGCGKTHMAAQVAKALGLRFGSISCSEGMSEGQINGKFLPRGAQGQFEFVSTELVDLVETGGVFLFDEGDAADPNIMLLINQLGNGRLPVPNRPEAPYAVRHPDFIMILTANTYGRGADRLYVGRNQLDEATLDRFRIGTVAMDYDTELERKICPNEQLRDRLWTIRNKAADAKLERIVSTRFLSDADDFVQAGVADHDYIVGKLLSGWSDDEKSVVGEF